VLKSGTKENLEELKRDVLQKEAVAEGKGREDEGNLLLSQEGEVDEIEKEMDIDSNLQLSATTEIDNDDIMKKQGDIEMKLRTFRRIPRPYNEVVRETQVSTEKKRALDIENFEVKDDQKRLRTSLIGDDDDETDDDELKAGLPSRSRLEK
jgi:hypothetical protein